MGTGTLFIYFKSKKELINTLYLEIYQRSSEEIVKDLNEEKPFKEQVRKLFLNYVKWALDNYIEFKFLLQFEHSPYFSDILFEQVNSDFLICKEFVLKGGIKERIFKNFPEDLIWDIMNGFHVAVIEYYHKENMGDNKLLNNSTVKFMFQIENSEMA